MTTYMIATFVVALFYGLFWNNRTARELARPENLETNRDEGAANSEHP